ncbi:MAG: hypothetical protein H6741_13870 [Alphaproteobacteria bacterium]|nr:hypothetical protein [Alphaproteobacteria bacterium]
MSTWEYKVERWQADKRRESVREGRAVVSALSELAGRQQLYALESFLRGRQVALSESWADVA